MENKQVQVFNNVEFGDVRVIMQVNSRGSSARMWLVCWVIATAVML